MNWLMSGHCGYEKWVLTSLKGNMVAICMSIKKVFLDLMIPSEWLLSMYM